MNVRSVLVFLKEKLLLADDVAKTRSVDIIQSEIIQLEQIYSTLLFGSFVGLPSPPAQIMLDLLPTSEESIVLLMNRLSTTNSPLSELASVFRID